MNCDDVRASVDIYLDGELAGSDAIALETHLNSCASCKQMIGVTNQLRRGIRKALRQVQTPVGLAERVGMSLDEEQPSVWRHASWALPTALAAGLGALALLPSFTPAPAKRATIVATPTKKSLQPRRVVVKRHPQGRTRSTVSERAASKGPLRMVANLNRAEVIGGGVGDDFLADDRGVRAIRTTENLRALVSSHQLALPPEVAGGASKVRAWLQRHAPQHSRLPIAEGAGVTLIGARLGHVGPHRVVSFRYRAFDRPVTVVRYLTKRSEARNKVAVAHGAVRDYLAGYSIVHAARQGDVLSIIGELDHRALTALIEPPSFL